MKTNRLKLDETEEKNTVSEVYKEDGNGYLDGEKLGKTRPENSRAKKQSMPAKPWMVCIVVLQEDHECLVPAQARVRRMAVPKNSNRKSTDPVDSLCPTDKCL